MSAVFNATIWPVRQLTVEVGHRVLMNTPRMVAIVGAAIFFWDAAIAFQESNVVWRTRETASLRDAAKQRHDIEYLTVNKETTGTRAWASCMVGRNGDSEWWWQAGVIACLEF
jgi:hypothetical protein